MLQSEIDSFEYEFEVPGKAQAKQRPRLGRFGKVYTPNNTHSYENWIKLCFIDKYKNFVTLKEDIFMEILIYKGIPKSTSKKKKEQMLLGLIKPTTKPDIDNIVKSIFDALNKIAYNDDSQICFLQVRKIYAEEEKVIIRFSER